MISEIREPGYLEGGDFFPAGEDLAMVGIGLRSNYEACHQLMAEDLLGTRRLAVVRDEFEQHQVSPPTNRTALGTCWKCRWPLQPCKGTMQVQGSCFTRCVMWIAECLAAKKWVPDPTKMLLHVGPYAIWTVFSASLATMCASCWTRCWARTAQQDAWWMSGCVMIALERYELARKGVEFSAFMRNEGYSIIPIKASDQLVLVLHPSAPTVSRPCSS